MQLDLPQNPEKYIQAQAGLDSRGMLVVAFGNPTQVPVRDLSVAIQYLDAEGRQREVVRKFSGVLSPGQQARMETGLGPFQSVEQYRVALASARIAE